MASFLISPSCPFDRQSMSVQCHRNSRWNGDLLPNVAVYVTVFDSLA